MNKNTYLDRTAYKCPYNTAKILDKKVTFTLDCRDTTRYI